MTGREKMMALIEKLRKDAERDYDLGIKLLDKASEELAYAEKLNTVISKVSDETCDRVMRKLEEEN